MFVVFFAVVFTVAHAAQELPSYLHVCGRNDTNYSQCIFDNVNNIKEKICTGIPELNISPSEPAFLNKIIIYDTDTLKLSIENTNVTKYCNLEITSLNMSPDKLDFNISYIIKKIFAESVYDFKVQVIVPLANKGIVNTIAENVKATASSDFKEVIKNGKKQIYVSKIHLKLDIKTLDIEFKDNEKDLVQLHAALQQILKENQEDIINKITPKLEELFSKIGISFINDLFYNRYEQLFPDKAP